MAKALLKAILNTGDCSRTRGTEYTDKFFSEGSREKIEVEISELLNYNKIVIKDPKVTSKELTQLDEDMQRTARKQPPIDCLQVGMACVAPFFENGGKWSRALIYKIDITGGLANILVFFVDIGIIDSIPVKLIRKMCEEWFTVPSLFHIAALKVQLVHEQYFQHVSQHMETLLGEIKTAEMVSRDPLSICLYEKSGLLCYQYLLDMELLYEI